MITFRDITLDVQRKLLLQDAHLSLSAGEKVVLCGPSGCGKSSLLKAAVGLMPLAAGSVSVGGVVLSAMTAAQIRGLIAFIGQEPVLGTEYVHDALMLPFTFKAHRHNLPDERSIAVHLERLHLPYDIPHKPCAGISGGEKQRIAIARALLLKKSVFLTDEITSALDPESRSAVMDQLFQPGITLLSVSHDPEWIQRTDRIIEFGDRNLHESVAGTPLRDRKPHVENTGSGGGK